MRKIQGTCCISWYKGIMTLKRETNTAELLLIKLAHQPPFCFAVWKTSLSREIQWYLISGKTGHDCWFFCPGCTHYVNMNQGLYLLFHYYVRVQPDCYFVIGRTQETSVFSKSTPNKQCILRNIEIKFTCPTNWQLQYVVGCV